MDTPPITQPIPLLSATDLVRRLSAKSISEQIDALDRERDALMVLLRAARRAEKPREVVRDAQ